MSEQVAGFRLEYPAGFVGIRSREEPLCLTGGFEPLSCLLSSDEGNEERPGPGRVKGDRASVQGRRRSRTDDG